MPRNTIWKRLLGPSQDATTARPPVTLRDAQPEDIASLIRLAELDSSTPPAGRVLVAEVGGELWAAVSVDSYHTVANSLRPTGDLVWRLTERAREIRRAERKSARRTLRAGGSPAGHAV
jgi:hypothetical protein